MRGRNTAAVDGLAKCPRRTSIGSHRFASKTPAGSHTVVQGSGRLSLRTEELTTEVVGLGNFGVHRKVVLDADRAHIPRSSMSECSQLQSGRSKSRTVAFGAAVVLTCLSWQRVSVADLCCSLISAGRISRAAPAGRESVINPR